MTIKNTTEQDLKLIATLGAVDLMAVVTEGQPEKVLGSEIPTVDVALTSRCRDCGQTERRDIANLWHDMWETISSSPAFPKTGWGKWAREHPEECPQKLRRIARYLTAGGAVVTVTNRHESRCAGCNQGNAGGSEPDARAWAQGHAELCRAMPVDEADGE